jgi:putative membrane protein
MSPEAQEIFTSWSPSWWLTASIVLVMAVYVRGWVAIRRTRPRQFTGWQLTSFLSGMAILWVVIDSPLDGFADALLSAHMVEHLLLMSAVPPLVLLGLPTVPLLRGLPRVVVRRVVGPLVRVAALRRLAHTLVTPLVAWLAMNITFLAWHVPLAYDYALEHEGWHDFEHLCFLSTSILFWWVILRPWPDRARNRDWLLLLYLASADVVNTGLSAFLAFCDRIVYPYYLSQPSGLTASPLSDQVVGAVIMWVVGSTVFLVPVFAIMLRMLRPARLVAVA